MDGVRKTFLPKALEVEAKFLMEFLNMVVVVENFAPVRSWRYVERWKVKIFWKASKIGIFVEIVVGNLVL